MLLEGGLVWAIFYFRWQTEEGWKRLLPALLGEVPAPIRGLIGGVIRKFGETLQSHAPTV